MKGLAIVHPGTEKIGAKEVRELTRAQRVQSQPSVVLFPVSSAKKLARAAYMGQSFKRVILFLKQFRMGKDMPDMKKKLAEVGFSRFLKRGTSFKVECIRVGDHNFSSTELAGETGAAILSKVKARVDLEKPDVTFLVYVYHGRCYVGVDFCGSDLSKRDYKIFSPPSTIKGTLAYCLVRWAGYSRNKIILDPFCGSAVIPIEAALFASGFSVNHYSKDKLAFRKLDQFKKVDLKKFFSRLDSESDQQLKVFGFNSQLRLVKQAQKNARIAGIKKSLQLSKVDVSWLDTKFEKGEVDCIVSHLPTWSKKRDLQLVKKDYNELFYQAKYVMNNKGKVVLACNRPDQVLPHAKKHGFRLQQQIRVMQGKQQLPALVLVKKA